MRRIVSIILLLHSLVFAQTPDTLSPEKSARYKISKIKNSTVRAITPTEFSNAISSVIDLAVGRVPSLTQDEVRAGKVGNSVVVFIDQEARSGTFRYVPGNIALDDSAMVIRSGSRRYVREYTGPINVKWFGAVGDGKADDTKAVQNAITYAGTNSKVFLPAGVYLITETLNLPRSVSVSGERGSKSDGSIKATEIVFRPVDVSKYLVDRVDLAPKSNNAGPFIFSDMKVNLAKAGGFRFGDETAPVADGSGQPYNFSVQFNNMAFLSAIVTRTQSSAGKIARSGRKQIWLTKAFDALIQNCSFNGSDTQIRLYGCDNPLIDNVRSKGSHVPIEAIGSFPFTATGNIRDFQCENWTFSPMLLKDCGMAVSRIRLEQNDGNPSGSRRFDLSTLDIPITFAVTAGSGTITASSSVENVIFPYLSVLELIDGVNRDFIVPTSVSGNTITYDTNSSKIDWSASAAKVVRVHSYGPICFGNNYPKQFSSVDCSVGDATPTIVMADNLGTVSVVGGRDAISASGIPHTSLVIPNRIRSSVYVNCLLSFVGCDDRIIADPAHPFVFVDNYTVKKGGFKTSGTGKLSTALASEEISTIFKNKWVFTPKSAFIVTGTNATVNYRKVEDSSNPAVYNWTWHITNGNTLTLTDKTLPTGASKAIKISIRWRLSTASSGDIRWQLVGTGASSPTSISGTNNWQTSVIYTNTVTYWSNASSNFGFKLSVGKALEAVEVSGVLIEDVADEAQFLTNASTALPTKSTLNSLYGSYKAGSVVNYPNIVGGGFQYRKADDSSVSDWFSLSITTVQ